MGSFSALICHAVARSYGQEASLVLTLKCDFRLLWLLKIFIKGLVALQESARCQIWLLLSPSENLCYQCGIWVKLASEICPQFKILLKTKKVLFLYCSLFKFLLAPLFLFASVLKKEG